MGYSFASITITIRIKKEFLGKIMGKYTIIIDGELETMLIEGAKSREISTEQFITDIVNRYLPLTHKINREEMAAGYLEMADINLELAK